MLPKISALFCFRYGICAQSTYYTSFCQSSRCRVPCETTTRFRLDFVWRFYDLVKPCQANKVGLQIQKIKFMNANDERN